MKGKRRKKKKEKNLVLVAKSVENEEHLRTSEGMLLAQMCQKNVSKET